MDEMKLINDSIEQNGRNQFTVDEEADLEQELNELMNSASQMTASPATDSSIDALKQQLPSNPTAPIANTTGSAAVSEGQQQRVSMLS